jgi:hypothetical protein
LLDKHNIEKQCLPILAELKDAHDNPLKTIVETIVVSGENKAIRKTVNIRGHFDSYGEKKVNFTAKMEFCLHNPNAARHKGGIWEMRSHLFSTNYPLNCPARISLRLIGSVT